MGRKFFVVTMKSAPTLRSMVALALLVIERAEDTAGRTSASPTIRAEAVAAVRRGLRRAFSRESRPVGPQIRGSGTPMPPTAGRLTKGLSMATPRKTQRPDADPEDAGVGEQPGRHAAMPSGEDDGCRRSHGGRRDASGMATSSRSAAIGGILVARRAGADGRHDGHDDADEVRPEHRVGLEDQTAWPGCRR